eukprot:gene28051-33871_t
MNILELANSHGVAEFLDYATYVPSQAALCPPQSSSKAKDFTTFVEKWKSMKQFAFALLQKQAKKHARGCQKKVLSMPTNISTFMVPPPAGSERPRSAFFALKTLSWFTARV